MSRLKYKLYYFMQGRRGMDYFSRFLLNTSIVLIVISMFLGRIKILALLLNLVILGVLIYTNFRIFSRNLYRREVENSRYLAWRDELKSRKMYRYFKCPHCGQKMRAPKGKGNIVVTCHQCNTSFKRKV